MVHRKASFSAPAPAERASSRLRLFALVGVVIFFAAVVAFSLSNNLSEISGYAVRSNVQPVNPPVLSEETSFVIPQEMLEEPIEKNFPPEEPGGTLPLIAGMSPDYSLMFIHPESGNGLFFANNGVHYYSMKTYYLNYPSSTERSFELSLNDADTGALIWTRRIPLPAGSRVIEMHAGKGAESADSFFVLTSEISTDYSSARANLLKFSSTGNGIPEWTRELGTYPPAHHFNPLNSLRVSENGSRIVVYSQTLPMVRVYTSQGDLLASSNLQTLFASGSKSVILSADGSTLAFKPVMGLFVFHLNSGSPSTPYFTDLPYIDRFFTSYSHAISKDGAYIAYWTANLNPSEFEPIVYNQIRILKKLPTGLYTPIFTDDIGIEDLRIPGASHLPYAQRLYSPNISFSGLPSAAFNSEDNLLIGTGYTGQYPESHSKNNLFFYRKTSSDTFERVSRYDAVFPTVSAMVVDQWVNITRITALPQSDFLVSFTGSPRAGSPEAFIYNPYENKPKKVFNFQYDPSFTGGSSGVGSASPDGSLVSYNYNGAPGGVSSYWATRASVLHSRLVPTVFSATDGLFVDRVRVSWGRLADVSSFDVFRNTVDDVFSAAQLNSSPLRALSFLDYTALPGQAYFYWIRARNGGNAFSFSKSDAGYRGIFPPSPAALTASQFFSDRVDLSWNYPSSPPYDLFPEATFSVYRSSTPSVPTTGVPYASNITTRSFTDTTPGLPGTVYYYAVVATNAVGSSGSSNVAMGHRFFPPSISSATPASSSSIHVTWTVPTNPPGSTLGYDLYYNDTGESCKGALISLGSASPSTVVSSLSEGVYYHFSIQSRGTNGVSECSSIQTATFLPPHAGCTIPGSAGYSDGSCGVFLDSSKIIIDGSVSYFSPLFPPWNVIRDATSANGILSAGQPLHINTFSFKSDRGLIAFNIAGLSGRTIVNATLEMKTNTSEGGGWSISGLPGGADMIHLMPWNPSNPSSSTISSTDYSRINRQQSNIFSSIDISTVPNIDSHRLYFPFNSVGVTYLQNSISSGRLNLGLIEHDVLEGNPYTGDVLFAVRSRLSFDHFARPRLFVRYLPNLGGIGPPTNLSTTLISSSSIMVTWAAPANPPGSILGYNLFYNTTGDACSGTLVSLGNVIGTTVTGLSLNTTYYFSVQTLGTTGVSYCSSLVSATTPPIEAPQNLSAGDGSNSGSVRVTWSSVSGAASYSVYRNTTNYSPTASLLQANVTSLSFNDSTATPGQVFYYWVKAVNASGTSLFSNGDSGYLLAWPTNVSAVPVSGSSIVVAWSNPTNPSGSVLGNTLFYNTTGGACSGTMVSLGTVSSYLVSGLTQGSTYYFSLQTRGLNGVSRCSTVASATAWPPSGCSIPGSTDNGDGTCQVSLSGSNIVVDGSLSITSASWDLARDSLTAFPNQTAAGDLVESRTNGPTSFTSRRGVFAFNVSSFIGREILGVTFEPTVALATGVSGGSDMIHLMLWSPVDPSSSTISSTDYSRITRQLSSRLANSVDISSISPSAIVSVPFSFNSSGVSYFQNSISSGRLNFGLIEHDSIENNPFTGGRLFFYMSEVSITGYRPKLIVRYR